MLVKFVCLNVWHGGRLFDEVVAFIKREDPDILALQEVYQSEDERLDRNFRALQEFRKVLGFTYDDYAPAFMNVGSFGKVEQGNAVFSKFPVVARDTVFYEEPYRERIDEPAHFPTTPRNLQHVELETPAGPVHVLNTQGVWDMDGDNYSPRRARMSDLMIAGAQGRPRVILGGDTNAKPTNKAIRTVEQHLTSVFGETLTTTFNMRRKTNPGYATAVVDMVFVGPDVKVVARDCPDVDISDHLPLVVTLEI